MRSTVAVPRSMPNGAAAVLLRLLLRIIGGARLASLIMIDSEIAGGARGRERAHDEKADLRRALHVDCLIHELIEAALNTPKATETKPSQIAEASSPAAIRLDRCGSTTCATK